MISAVGIKRILFADIDKVTADITPEIAKTLIQAAIKAKDEVLNVHGEDVYKRQFIQPAK